MSATIKKGIKDYGSIELFHLLSGKSEIVDNYFNNFTDFELTKNKIQRIGVESFNGAVYKIAYENNGIEFGAILKKSNNEERDNLVYDYLVGICINEFAKQFPFFSKTFSLVQYTDAKLLKKITNKPSEINLPNLIKHYTERSLEKLIVQSCEKSGTFGVVSPFIPVYKTFAGILNGIMTFDNKKKIYVIKKPEDIPSMIGLFYIIYTVLNSLKEELSHYDLHGGNVLIIKCPDGKHFEYKIHISSKKIVTIKSQYYPVIIDFGRSWVSCNDRNIKEVTKQKKTPNVSTSHEIMATVCKNDYIEKAEKGKCQLNCGNKRGYESVGEYSRKHDKFSDERYSMFNRAKRNISIDLLLIHSIQFSPLSQIIKPKYMEKWSNVLKSVDFDLGLIKEVKKSPKGIIANVPNLCKALESIVLDKEYVKDMNNFNKGKRYGIMDLYISNKKPFKFTLG